MLRDQLQSVVSATVASLVSSGRLPEGAREVRVEIQDTKNPEHGDFATNFAMIAAKPLGINPRQVGEALAEALRQESVFEAVEVAGPGFVNLRLKPAVISGYVPRILDLGSDLSKSKAEQPKRINVEFVSVNPNGPITVGSGRGAAYGDTICRVFEAAGHQPYREYYINDGVNSEQMRQFALSVRAHALGEELPEKAYRGEYVADVAEQVKAKQQLDGSEDAVWWQRISQDLMIERQRGDLALFGVNFDTWFSEQSLHDEDKVSSAMQKLQEQGNAYPADKPADADEDPEEELLKEESEHPDPHVDPASSAQDVAAGGGGKALWLRSSAYGDDKDRVLVRADGRPAYIAADVAYMENKLGERGFDKAIIVLGPDHHGYIARMNAVCQALGYPLERFEIIIFQIVRFVKDGKPAPMRKRDGNIYELRDLITELGASAAPNAEKQEQQRIGADVARYFYLMRSHDTHMDFDIDLATKQSDENPVFYAQYAHARICSVLAKAQAAGFTASKDADVMLLTHPRELALIKKILDLPFEVKRIAEDYGVHRLTTFATELAKTYHLFYDACRVIQPDQPELTKARLALCEAAKVAFKANFDLLGISAPERMDREQAEPPAE